MERKPSTQYGGRYCERGGAHVEETPNDPLAQWALSRRAAGSYKHDAIIDAMITNPFISQQELAALFGYSRSWISQLQASDAFQERCAERAAELHDPAVLASMKEQNSGLHLRSMDVLREKFEQPAEKIPFNQAVRLYEVSGRNLGYGARVEQPPAQADMEKHLETLADNLVKLLRKKKAEAAAEKAGSASSDSPPDRLN